MPPQREHQSHGVLVVITPGKPHDVHVVFPLRDRMGDVSGTLDGVDHEHKVPHALASVGPEVAAPGWVRIGHER